MNNETRRTVLVAGGANLFIAVCKVVAGLISGSSAMLAEGAHSVADTVNQGFTGRQALVPIQTIRHGELFSPEWGPYAWGWLPEQA